YSVLSTQYCFKYFYRLPHLFVRVEEVGRDAQAHTGTPVNKHLSLREACRRARRVLDADHDGAAALLRLARAVQTPPVLQCELDHPLGSPARLRGDSLKPDLFDDVESGEARVESRNVRRALREAAHAPRVAHLARERERLFVRDPAREARAQLALQFGPHVEVAARWPAAQPLDRAADEKVHAPLTGLQLRHARRLVRVEHDERTHTVRAFDNRARVNAVRASVRGVRERDEAGRLVYRF